MDFCGGMRWFCGDYHTSCDFSSNITWLEQESCCISSNLCAIRFWQTVKLWPFNSRFLFLARYEVPFSSDLCCVHCHDPSLGCYCQAKSFPGWSAEVWVAAGDCSHEHQQVREALLPAPCAIAQTPWHLQGHQRWHWEGQQKGVCPWWLSSKTADKEPPQPWEKQIILSVTAHPGTHGWKPGNWKHRWWSAQIVRL